MTLTDAQRQLVAQIWLRRAGTEANAVPGFEQVLADLQTLGAPDALLQIARDAIVEEAEHVRLCVALAERYAGRTLEAPVSTWQPPRFTGIDDELHPLLRILVATALSETLSSSFLALLYQRALDPDVKETLRRLLADEVDHARIGWATLALPSITDAQRALVGAYLPHLLGAIARQWSGGADDDLAAHGCLSRAEVAAHTKEAIETLVLPGFAALGIDTTPARRSGAP